MKVGDKVGYIKKDVWGHSVNTVKSIEGNQVNYVEGGYDLIEDLMVEESAPDVVQAPAHYNSTKINSLEVIDDWKLDFYLGNVLKYIQRHTLKGNPLQDLEKAKRYLEFKIERLKNEQEAVD